jgi:phosphatidylglycerophosphate synthase
MVKHIPNILSGLRIAAMPLIIAIAIQEKRELFFILLIIAQFTDFLDGYLARKLKAQSNLGAKLDIVGDSCNYLAGTVGLIIFYPQLLEGFRIWTILLFTSLYMSRFFVAHAKTGEWIYPVNHISAKINFHFQSILVAGMFFDVSFISFIFYVAFVTGMIESGYYLHGLTVAEVRRPYGSRAHQSRTNALHF